MPVGTAFHERTFPLCQSLNYREWSGYYAVSVYEVHHEHEYNAIRNAAALIDISPLYKYLITGKDATKLVNRIITRDITKVKVGQVIYCCWCDEQGKVIDDGTITRLEENKYRWTAADPSLRWFRQNGLNMDVQVEDISEQLAALALQGPTSGKLLKAVAEADIANLKYFRMTRGKIGNVFVDISRTGYTGDLGYEIWVPWNDAVKVWDAVMEKGKQFDHPRRRNAGAGCGPGRSRAAADRSGLHQRQESADRVAEVFALRTGLRKDGSPGERKFHRQSRLGEDSRSRACRGSSWDWKSIGPKWKRVTRNSDSRRQRPARLRAWLFLVYLGEKQVGKATTTTWSPVLKKMIALASVDTAHSQIGTKLQMEITIEAMRQQVTAKVVKMPFFNPERKTATPV